MLILGLGLGFEAKFLGLGLELVALALAGALKSRELTTREWTSRHEEAGVDIARVDNVARRSKGGPVSYTHLTLPTNREV